MSTRTAYANRFSPSPFPPHSVEKPKPRRQNVSSWVRFRLWLNTYRYVEINRQERSLIIGVSSKFFIFVVSINLTGLVMAASGKWSYARHYSGAFVLGNLLVAILMRNELFGRLLYLIVNTLFAKVPFRLHGVGYTRC